jgi:hypothetical protein
MPSHLRTRRNITASDAMGQLLCGWQEKLSESAPVLLLELFDTMALISVDLTK